MTAADKPRAREYELVYILKPNVNAAEARKVSDRIVDVVEKVGAKLTHVDNWGKRKLAYPIKRHKRGIFVFVKLVGFNDMVSELERNLRILDDVVRYQTVRLEEVDDLTSLDVDPEEIAFRDIEGNEDDDDDEPTFEERLGMRSRSREREAPAPSDGEAGPEGDNTDTSAEGAAAAEGSASEGAATESAEASDTETASPSSEGESTETTDEESGS